MKRIILLAASLGTALLASAQNFEIAPGLEGALAEKGYEMSHGHTYPDDSTISIFPIKGNGKIFYTFSHIKEVVVNRKTVILREQTNDSDLTVEYHVPLRQMRFGSSAYWKHSTSKQRYAIEKIKMCAWRWL